jgi:hypothetical protein
VVSPHSKAADPAPNQGAVQVLTLRRRGRRAIGSIALTRARPRIVTKEAFDPKGLPDNVQVALAQIAGAAREGVIALSVACGFQVVRGWNCRPISLDRG